MLLILNLDLQWSSGADLRVFIWSIGLDATNWNVLLRLTLSGCFVRLLQADQIGLSSQLFDELIFYREHEGSPISRFRTVLCGHSSLLLWWRLVNIEIYRSILNICNTILALHFKMLCLSTVLLWLIDHYHWYILEIVQLRLTCCLHEFFVEVAGLFEYTKFFCLPYGQEVFLTTNLVL